MTEYTELNTGTKEMHKLIILHGKIEPLRGTRYTYNHTSMHTYYPYFTFSFLTIYTGQRKSTIAVAVPLYFTSKWSQPQTLYEHLGMIPDSLRSYSAL